MLRRSQATPARIEHPTDAGILLVTAQRGSVIVPSLSRRLARGLPVVSTPERSPVRPLPFNRVMRWDGQAHIRPDLIRTGLRLLSFGWEVAVPLDDAQRLAAELSTQQDRDRTAALIGDLRIPVYDPRVLFLRRSAGAEQLLKEWEQQRSGGGDPRLAFLRALFIAAPKTLALPPTWIMGKRAA